MTQQFTPSTDGQNVSIAAGADPTYTARVRGVNWRPDVMLALSSAAELRTTQFADADTYYVRGVGEVLWDEDDTTADNGTTVFQITGVPTGRYKLTGGSSFLATLPGGTTAEVSGTDTTLAKSPSVVSGKLLLPRAVVVHPALDTDALRPICALDSRKGLTVSSGVADAWASSLDSLITATASAGARPTVDATGWSDGGQCVTFDGSAHWMIFTSIARHLEKSASRTVAALVRLSSVSGNRCLLGGSSSSAGTMGLEYYCEGDKGAVFINDTATAASASSASALTTTRDHLIVWSHTAGANSTTVWIDGQKTVLAANLLPSALLAFTVITLGCFAPAASVPGQFFAGKVRYLDVFEGTATDESVMDISRAWLGAPHLNIVCDGDSLTEGGGATGANYYYPAQLERQLQKVAGKCYTHNLGRGGYTITQMADDFASRAVPLKRTGSVNVYVAWGGTNDAYYNADGATIAARYWAWVDAAVAAGFEVLAVTQMPRGDFNAGQLQALTDFNALVVAGYRDHGCFACDRVDQIAVLQDPANTTYFADTIHLTDAGYRVRAANAAQHIGRLASQL